MTHQIIDAKKAAHKIVVSCKLMGVSPSGYFACKKRGCERRRPCRDRVALAHLRERFSPSGETARRNRIARLMRENDLKAHQKRRFKKTTDSAHKGRIAPNSPMALITNEQLTYPMFGQPGDASILHASSIFSHAALLALQ
jgi:putative transposase